MAAFIIIHRKSAEWMLIYRELLYKRGCQSHVVLTEHSGRVFMTHVFNRVLLTDIVVTLDVIVHVPNTVAVGVGIQDGPHTDPGVFTQGYKYQQVDGSYLILGR